MKEHVRRTMLMLVVATIAVRLLAVTIAMATTDLRPDDLARLRDGPAYLAYASAITEGFAGLAEYDRRVFPGYPLLLALLGAVRWPLIAVFLNWLAAGAAAALAYRLCDDVRVGWAMAVLTPSYVLYSTTVMSEAVVVWVVGVTPAESSDLPSPADPSSSSGNNPAPRPACSPPARFR